jgi:hypothetical protein
MRLRRCGVNLQEIFALLGDDLFSVIETAATLRFAPEAGVCRFSRWSPCTGGLADLALGDPIANTDDHDSHIVDNANYSQEEFIGAGKGTSN